MDETVAEYIRRTVLKIPRDEIKTMLQKWGFLSETQLQSINFHQIKENISQDVVQLCEVSLSFGNCLSATCMLECHQKSILTKKRIFFGHNTASNSSL